MTNPLITPVTPPGPTAPQFIRRSALRIALLQRKQGLFRGELELLHRFRSLPPKDSGDPVLQVTVTTR